MPDTRLFPMTQNQCRATAHGEFYIDRGGTFTDVVAESPDGALQS